MKSISQCKLQARAAIAATMAIAGAVAVLGLSGCGAMPTSAGTEPSTYSNAATLTGIIHGGQQAVGLASVQLYAAGTGGYGQSGTLLATTSSAAGTGTFALSKSSTNGTSSGTGTTWACPATTDDPQLYIVATGGTSDGVATDLNNAITLVAALGPCSGVTNSTFVIIDEVSTTAAAFALAPYITPGTTAGATVTIGTNGANLPTSTPQGAVGLNNAVAGIANLVATTPPAYTNAGVTSVALVTVTATAEPNKVNTIADILAACINQASSSANQCKDLFNSALSTSGTKPTDTFQAAYNMATNPANAGTFTGCLSTTSPSPASNLGCLFGLATATSPFQSTLSAAPTDWTIGVTYTASGTGCANNGFGAGLFFDAPTRAAVDANGNIYIVNGSQSKATIVEMSPIGKPLACVIPQQSATVPQTFGSSISIDPTGNVWATFSHGTLTGQVEEWPVGTTLPVGYAPTAEVEGIASDGDGNIFYATVTSGAILYEFVAPTSGSINLSTATPVVAASPFATGQTGTIILHNLLPDSQGRLFGNTGSISSIPAAYALTATITGYSVTGTTVTFTGTNTFTTGQTVTIADGSTFNGQRLVLTAATASTFSATTTASPVGTTADTGTARATGASAYTTVLTSENSASYGLGMGAYNSATNSNFIYTGTACCSNGGPGKAEKFLPAATAVAGAGSASTAFIGGLSGTRSVAVDGAGKMWMGQYQPETTASPYVYGLAEINATTVSGTTTYTAISPTGTAPTCTTTSDACAAQGGFQKAAFLAMEDVEIDPSGNVWVLNTGPNTLSSPGGTINTASGSQGLSVTELVGAATPVVTPFSVAAHAGTLGTKP